MAPKKKLLTSADLQEQYADTLKRSPYCDARSPFLLHKALQTLMPGRITIAAVKHWWDVYRSVEGADRISTAQQLQDRHGDSIAHLAQECKTAWKLCNTLSKRQPPIFVSNSIAKEWLRDFGIGITKRIESAGHLEIEYGEKIREHMPFPSSDDLSSFLCRELQIECAPHICRFWMDRDWSRSGILYSPTAVEENCGCILRLGQYSGSHSEIDRYGRLLFWVMVSMVLCCIALS